MEKYGLEQPPPPPTPNQRLIQLANERVRVEWVLRDFYNIRVPEGATSWRTSCPWAQEHSDGGVGRTFRVYPETNSAHCFASHGHQTPVKLWASQNKTSMPGAAGEMLSWYQVGPVKESYRQKMDRLRTDVAPPPIDLGYLLQRLLPTHPAYVKHQFDSDVRALVVAWSEDEFPEDDEEFKEKFRKWKDCLWKLLDAK